jgi:hypothetical protein
MEKQQSSGQHQGMGGEISLAPHPERLAALTERFRASSPEDRAYHSLGALIAVVDGMADSLRRGDQTQLTDWLCRGMAVVAALEAANGAGVSTQNGAQL